MNVKKVLLIEDYDSLQKLITEQLKIVFGKTVEVVVAGSLKVAEELYEAHVRDVDMILMDTHLGGGENTFALAKRISMEFNRPIVAISTDEVARETLVKRGWRTHQCNKSDLLKFLTEWKVIHQ